MIKYSKIDIDDVKSRLVNLKHIFPKYKEVMAVYLFGSFHKGNITPLSDVDIAILLENHISQKN